MNSNTETFVIITIAAVVVGLFLYHTYGAPNTEHFGGGRGGRGGGRGRGGRGGWGCGGWGGWGRGGRGRGWGGRRFSYPYGFSYGGLYGYYGVEPNCEIVDLNDICPPWKPFKMAIDSTGDGIVDEFRCCSTQNGY
jgi:hypothetical protein